MAITKIKTETKAHHPLGASKEGLSFLRQLVLKLRIRKDAGGTADDVVG